MGFKVQPFEVRNFNLGIVEDFQNFDRRANVILENLWHTDDNKLESRFGSLLLSSPNQRIPSHTRITSLVPELDGSSNFFTITDRKLFYLNPDWTELQGPTGNLSLTKMESDGQVSSPTWQEHLFLTDDSFSKTVKVFRNSSNVLTLVEAGLPALDGTVDDFNAVEQTGIIIQYANLLKAELNIHFNHINHGGLGPTHKVADPNLIITIDATTLATGQALLAEIRTSFIRHRKDIDDGNFTYHTQNSIPWTDLLTGPANIFDQVAPTGIPETIDQINRLMIALDAHFINQFPHNAGDVSPNDPANMPFTPALDPTIFFDPLTQIKTGVHPVRDRSAIDNHLSIIRDSYLSHIQNGADPSKAHSVLDLVNDLGSDANSFDPPPTVATFSLRRLRLRDFAVNLIDKFRTVHATNDQTSVHVNVRDVSKAAIQSDVDVQTFFYSIPFGDYSAFSFQLNDFSVKYNLHDNDMGMHYESGANNPLGGLHNIPTPVPVLSNYIYSLHYFYSYTVGDITFEDNGPITTVSVLNTSPVESVPITIRNIPEFINTSHDNVDTTNLKIKIFRTQNNQTVGRLVGIIDNGTTSFVDSTPDSELLSKAQLYTTGGVLQNDVVPKAKFLTIFNNIGWYANLDIGGDLFPKRIRQSISNDIDGTPATFFKDMPFNLTGISFTGANVIAFGDTAMSRLTGNFTETGGGLISAEIIANTVGAVSHKGIVQVEGGLYFAGNDGIYFTDGFKLNKLTEQLDKFYSIFVQTAAQRRRIYGTYDAKRRHIWWSMSSSSDNTENDMCLVLDTTKSLRANSSFSVMLGNNKEFQPAALLFQGRNLLRGDFNGFIFKHEDRLRSDPKKDISVSDSDDWTTSAIKWRIRSLNVPFGTGFIKKWVPRMNMTAKDAGDVSIGLTSINDNKKKSTLTDILHRLIKWGEPNGVFSSTGWVTTWRDPIEGIVDKWRRFKANNLRCEFKQMEFKNADGNITKSDTWGLATINATTKVITLDNSLSAWPKNPEDYRIALQSDSFVQEFLITSSLGNRPNDLLFYTSFSQLMTGTTTAPVIDYSKSGILPVYQGDLKGIITAGEYDLGLMTLNTEFPNWDLTDLLIAPQQLTLRFSSNPNFTGNPAVTQSSILSNGPAFENLNISMLSNGNMRLVQRDDAGVILFDTQRSNVSYTSGTKVSYEYNIDFATGVAMIFANGTKLGANIAFAAATGPQWSDIQLSASVITKVFKFDDLTLFSTIKNTANHTLVPFALPPDITVEDDDGDLSTLSAQKWVIRGVQKEEKFSILNYIIQWAPFGRAQDAFHKSDSGENT